MQHFFSALDSQESGRDGDAIAKTIGRMINDGTLAEGDRLPPIRSIARHLGVSSSTVAGAWSIMRRHGLISTDRRRGTTIRPLVAHGRNRYWQVPTTNGRLPFDLSTGTPDPELLPPLEPILAKVHTDLDVTSYLDPPVLPELAALLRQRWPYPPPRLTVLDGANDGLDRVVGEIVRLGDVVVVEDPTYPLLLDILDVAGAEVVGVGLDHDGPRLDEVAVALNRRPRALIVQTGAHNPTGITMSAARAKALAELVAPTETVVVEDDHAGAGIGSRAVSLGRHLPDRVFRIESFSKTYGPDLRIAALAGPEEGVDQVQRRRQMGPGWTSRLTQRILLEMLNSDEVGHLVAEANRTYRERRETLAAELSGRDVDVRVGQGLNLWIPVGSEQLATVALATGGIGVSPGTPFRVSDPAPHIRVTAANLRSNFDRVAAAIGAAADPHIGR